MYVGLVRKQSFSQNVLKMAYGPNIASYDYYKDKVVYRISSPFSQVLIEGISLGFQSDFWMCVCEEINKSKIRLHTFFCNE